jgi:hypothetical protein
MNEYEASSGAFAAIGVVGSIFYLAIIVLMIAGMWKIFEKAGKPGWAAIIPIYNLIILLEIVGKPTIWILWLLIPCVNFVFAIWLYNLVSKSFGKSEGYTVGLILLPFVFWPLLGFGPDKYLGPSAAEANGFGGNQGGFGNQNFGQGGFGQNNPFNDVNNPFKKDDNTPPTV